MKVEKVIASFNPIERNRLRKFIESPYFNPNSDIITLFDLIESNVRNSIELDAQEYWKKTMPGKKFNSGLFRKNCSTILKLIEQFLAVEAMQSSELSQTEFLEIQIRQRKLDRILGSNKFFELSKIQNQNEIQTSDYLRLYTINKLRFESHNDFERRIHIEKAYDKLLNLKELDLALQTFYTLEKLKLSLIANNLKQISTESIPVIIEADHLQRIKEIVNRDENNILLRCYWILHQLLVSGNVSTDYTEILNALEKSSLNHYESLLIFEYLLNYFVREDSKLENGFYHRHQIHELGLKFNFFLNDGVIDPIDYSNIIFTACRISNYSWALDFAEEYKEFLNVQHRRTAYSFNKARIHWYNNDFEKVIETLRNVDYEDLTYNLNSKLMILTSFFELDEYDLVDSTIKSFKVFLRRRRNIPAARKKSFYSFCEVLGHILKAEERADLKHLLAAKKLIETNNSIPNINWLSQKIAESEKIIK